MGLGGRSTWEAGAAGGGLTGGSRGGLVPLNAAAGANVAAGSDGGVVRVEVAGSWTAVDNTRLLLRFPGTSKERKFYEAGQGCRFLVVVRRSIIITQNNSYLP